MEEHNIRLHAPIAFRSPEIRRACCAIEAVFRAVDILDREPPVILELVRDFCDDVAKGRKDHFSDFKRAYITLVIDQLNDAKLRERRLFHGITGLDEGIDDDPGAPEHPVPDNLPRSPPISASKPSGR
jgi:hypothetical protein